MGDGLLAMLQTFLALGVVCGLAYLVFRVILPRLSFSYKTNSMVRIVDRVAIDARKSLCVIEVAGRWMLIAVTENGVEQICELDPDSAKVSESEIVKARTAKSVNAVGNGFADKITELMKKNQGGK